MKILEFLISFVGLFWLWFDKCREINFGFSISLNGVFFWLNCGLSPLTFLKLRFWPLRKIIQNSPLSFATVAVLAPQGKKKITCGTSLRVPRQRRPNQYQPWRPKLPQVQNLGGCFVVFFLRGPKSQLWES